MADGLTVRATSTANATIVILRVFIVAPRNESALDPLGASFHNSIDQQRRESEAGLRSQPRDEVSFLEWSSKGERNLARATHVCHTLSRHDEGVSFMAVLIEDVFPAVITIDLLDALTDDVGVDAKLPPGAFMHLHFERDGRAHGVDVWDSIEAHELFVESTLMPALGKLAARKRHRSFPAGRARGNDH